MPNYRESLPSTLESGLQDGVEGDIRPVDRLRAFSHAPTTGTLLWRVYYDERSQFYPELVSRLVSELEMPQYLIELALHEYMNRLCRRCKGVKELTVGEKRIECPACQHAGKGPTGLHRYSDKERAQYLRMSVSKIRRQNKKLDRALRVIGNYDRSVNVSMNIRLPIEN